MRIRDATAADASGCAAVYAPYVEQTAITFETEVPDAADFARRIAAAQQAHAWLVAAEDDGTVAGYAYGTRMKERAAYDWSAEVSVYLRMGLRRSGLGRALYGALFDRLRELGYCTLIAGMTLPNDASAGLHRAMGFETVGVYRAIGFKLGRWQDVQWMQLRLASPPGAPRPLRRPPRAS